MRFMVIVKSNSNCATAAAPDGKFIGEMRKFNDELTAAGVLLALEGLHPDSKGARARPAAGKWKVSDGPFAETKELIGGYWLWQVNSRDEALEWVKRCPIPAHGETEIELRQVLDTQEFAAQLAPAFTQRAQRTAA
jgi:hypothetical protein